VSKRLELATEVMGPHAGLHPDQTGRHIGEARFNLAMRPLLSQHNGAPPILANDVERILPDIDADYGDRALQCLCHGVLLVFGVPASLIALAGQEHGRTIPLAEVVHAGESVVRNATREHGFIRPGDSRIRQRSHRRGPHPAAQAARFARSRHSLTPKSRLADAGAYGDGLQCRHTHAQFDMWQLSQWDMR
jgi:hypothetical protein